MNYSKEELKLLTTINLLKNGYIRQLERKFGIDLVYNSELMYWITVQDEKWKITDTAIRIYSEIYKESFLSKVKNWIVSFFVWIKIG